MLAKRVGDELHVGVFEVAAREGAGEGYLLHMRRLHPEGWGAFRQPPHLAPGALVKEGLEVDDHSRADYVAAKSLPHDRPSEPGPGGCVVKEPVAVTSRDPVVEPGDEHVEQGADDVLPSSRLEVQVVGDVLHRGRSGRIAQLSEGLDDCLAHGRSYALAKTIVPKAIRYDAAGGVG
jgi:hypothetical protein